MNIRQRKSIRGSLPDSEFTPNLANQIPAPNLILHPIPLSTSPDCPSKYRNTVNLKTKSSTPTSVADSSLQSIRGPVAADVSVRNSCSDKEDKPIGGSRYGVNEEFRNGEQCMEIARKLGFMVADEFRGRTQERYKAILRRSARIAAKP